MLKINVYFRFLNKLHVLVINNSCIHDINIGAIF